MLHLLAAGLMMIVYTPEYSEERADAVYAFAEAKAIAQLCGYAEVDEAAISRVVRDLGIDMLNDNTLRHYYLDMFEERYDALWVKGRMRACRRGYEFYGPMARPERRFLIFDKPLPE